MLQRMGTGRESETDVVVRIIDVIEAGVASGLERLVQGEAFAELFAKSTENVIGLTKVAFGALDLVVRNLRIAGRSDIIQLTRQLARTEDKLEVVLQEVEGLRLQLEERAVAHRVNDNEHAPLPAEISEGAARL
jgi:hypothetical protein